MKKELRDMGKLCLLVDAFGSTLRCSRTICTFSLEVPDLGSPEYYLFNFRTVPSFLNLRTFLCMVDVEGSGVLKFSLHLFDALAVNVSPNQKALFIISQLHFKKYNIFTSGM